MTDHPQDLSLRAQAEAIRVGELDATELLEETLARIEERDPALNSVVDRFAAESAQMLAEAPDGPLHGVPIGVKDEFALPWRAPRDGAYKNTLGMGPGESGVFRLLRDAGAVVVGVTHMHELGIGSTGHISIYGPCGNPWDPSRCAGGSSSGSAAAVGARLVAGAIGADGGGSIRYPAAYCGVTGLKPTWGRIPVDGALHGYLSLGVPGPICRDAGDTRLLAEVLLDQTLEPGSERSLRIGLPRAQLWSDLDPEVERACGDAIDLLRDAGATLGEVTLDGAELSAIATVLPLSMEGLPEVDRDAAAEVAPHLSPIVRALTKYGLLTPAAAWVKAERVRALLRLSMARLFSSCDVLAWPSAPTAAPPIENTTVHLPSGYYSADYANVRLGGIANLTGVPAISVPCGLTAERLPVGIQFLAPWGEEARLLDIAELHEKASDRRCVEALPPVAAPTTA